MAFIKPPVGPYPIQLSTHLTLASSFIIIYQFIILLSNTHTFARILPAHNCMKVCEYTYGFPTQSAQRA